MMRCHPKDWSICWLSCRDWHGCRLRCWSNAVALAPITTRRRADPMIALINIVFLMLVFFLIAAAIAPPLDRSVTLVEAERLEGRAPPDAAVIRADGTMMYRGSQVTPAAYLASRSEAE